MRRGLTLIELLLALALLSGIVIAAGSWTQIAGHAATAASEPIRLQMAANAALQLIHDDLAVGDLGESTDLAHTTPARVVVTDGDLVILTRDSGIGSVMHRYRFDSVMGTLDLRSQGLAEPANAPAQSSALHVLAVGISRFEPEINQVRQQLTVTIELSSQKPLSRSYRLP